MSSPRHLHSLYRLDYDADDGSSTVKPAPVQRDGQPSLLLTKLHPPRLPADHVTRLRLAKASARIPQYPLTLVSAPTGFGKSVLVSQAVAELAVPTAWLSLDEYDNELHTFLDYLIAAIETQFPTACAQTSLLLDAVSPMPTEHLAASLLNAIEAIATPFVLVLDDFHHLTDPAIGQLFATLLRALPAPLHLVVITQTDPPWPLQGLAGRGQLHEIRAADLRFRPEEARAFLENTTGVALPTERVESLAEQTEGWIVALRLAALTLGSALDLSDNLSDLTVGEGRLMPRLLVQAVLARQSPAVRDFLLRTSILDRLNPALCAEIVRPLASDAPAGPTAQAIAAWLQDTNLFIVPLGETGEWYRYHHLFRELVKRELTSAWKAVDIQHLHRRAADWYTQHGLAEEAVRHYLAAGDTHRAADIMEVRLHDLLNGEDWRGTDHWLRLLPDDVLRGRPRLMLLRVSAYSYQFDARSMLRLLTDVEAMLANPDARLSEAERHAAAAEIALMKAVLQFWPSGQLAASLEHTALALKDLPREYLLARSTAMAYHGMALYASGRQAAGLALLRQVVGDPAEPPEMKVRALVALAFIQRASGPLDEFEHTIEMYQRVATEHRLPASMARGHFFKGSLHYERNELEEAVKALTTVMERRYQAHFASARDSMIDLALTYQALGRSQKAQEIARDLTRFSLERNGSSLVECQALQVRLALARQDLDEARRVARELPDTPPTEPMILATAPAITRAQALLVAGAPGERAQALDMLAVLAAAAEASYATRPLVRILALQAVGLAATGCGDEALAKVERAVTLAEPMRLIRTFVDIGPALAPLLRRVLERSVTPAYLRQVLDAFAAETAPARPDRLIEYEGSLLEPLTDRELEVLRLLSQGLSTKEIAAALVISPATAKRHLNNLYPKLGVHRRREAMQRAQAIGLLPRR